MPKKGAGWGRAGFAFYSKELSTNSKELSTNPPGSSVGIRIVKIGRSADP
jgi:hypothetical protein